MIYIDVSDRRCFHLKNSLLAKNFKVKSFEAGAKYKAGDVFIFSPAKKFDANFANVFPNECKIFCGNLPEDVLKILACKNIVVKNITLNEEFIVKNANLTAEGVLAIVLKETEFSLYDAKILILGSGRLAKAYCAMFEKLGVKTTIMARREVEIAQAFLYASNALNLSNFKQEAKKFNVIINTIPAKILSKDLINNVATNTLFIETASVKCLEEGEVKNFVYYFAPGLPGKYTSFSAAKIMEEIILKEISND